MHKKLLMVMTLSWANTFALNAATIADGSFLNWTFASFGTAEVTRETADGNPGARLNVTTVSGEGAAGIAVNNNFSTNDALSGQVRSASVWMC